MKKLKYIFFYSISAIFGFVILYTSAVFVFPFITVNSNLKHPEEIEIYIITNGMHTDIVMPVKTDLIDWSDKIQYEHTLAKDSVQKYIAMGWGDKSFFLDVPDWDHVEFSIAFKAATGLGSSAMHATYYKSMQEGEDCIKIMISKEQYKILVNYIVSWFRYDLNGNPVYIVTENTYGNNDCFYEAVGTYSLFFSCNTWANDALKKAKMKACFWALLQEDIFSKYK